MSELFQEELELEKKEGRGLGPMIIIIFMVAAVVGVVGWLIHQQMQQLKPELATQFVGKSLQARGPATVSFHTGTLPADMTEGPSQPHYALLEKAGVLKVTRPKKGPVTVQLTPEGEKLIAGIDGVKKVTEKQTTAYTVPLATRKLLGVDNIKKVTAQKFEVSYRWQWAPNELGNKFDAGGDLVKSFPAYARSVLINKHGADRYHDPPTKETIFVVKEDAGWRITTE